MDDLRNIRERLTEMVEAKMARATALRAEADAIDAELIEAQAMLGTPAPVLAVRRGPKMPRPAVLAYLTARGPQEPHYIRLHFGVMDARGANVFSLWVKGGFLVRLSDGRLAVPDRPALHVVG